MATAALPFDELLSFVVDNRGRTCPTASTGLPLIATNCISNEHMYPTKENVRYVDQETYLNWFRAHPLPGDIIFVLKGAPGRCALVPDPVDFCIAQDMVAVRADSEKIDPQYLFAALRSPLIQESIDRMHVGTMIPHFKKGDFNKLLIPLPDRRIQEFIGSVHMALVEKIELNRRMNETMEAMAQAIFKDWFVDFGPTRAKMKSQSPYLTAEIWSLFPDRLDDEGKPHGWEHCRLLDLCELKRGYDLPLAQREGGSVPIISSSGFSGTHNRSMAAAPGIVTGRYGTIGEVFFIEEDFWPLNTALYVSDFKESAPRFVFYVLKSIDFMIYSDKGAVPGINRNHLHEHVVIKPSPDLERQFASTLEPFWQRQRLNELENASLSETRDLLLPKLMSGEIRVKDAEKLVGEAT
jgi:type I restriction enzyme S subunit